MSTAIEEVDVPLPGMSRLYLPNTEQTGLFASLEPKTDLPGIRLIEVFRNANYLGKYVIMYWNSTQTWKITKPETITLSEARARNMPMIHAFEEVEEYQRNGVPWNLFVLEHPDRLTAIGNLLASL